MPATKTDPTSDDIDVEQVLREVVDISRELGLNQPDPATVPAMRRAAVSANDRRRINTARAELLAAEKEMRAAVLSALANGASIREVAIEAGLAKATVQAWKKEAGE